MANPLNLFPARVPIGRVTPTGDVLQTKEFSNALSDLLAHLGGPAGTSIVEIMREIARRPSTLAQSAAQVTLSGSTEEKVMASVRVPANAMGPSGMVRITTTWSVAHSQKNKTIITRFGGSEVGRNAVTTVSTYQEQQRIQNRNTSLQVFIFGGYGYTGAPIGTLNKDTSKAQQIDIVAQLEDAADSITLEAYTVELIPTT